MRGERHELRAVIPFRSEASSRAPAEARRAFPCLSGRGRVWDMLRRSIDRARRGLRGEREGDMRLRAIVVSVATAGLMVGPAFVHGTGNSASGAKAECTITGTAADDSLTGTTRDDVICTKAGADNAYGLEGNDIIRGGQGDDDELEGG